MHRPRNKERSAVMRNPRFRMRSVFYQILVIMSTQVLTFSALADPGEAQIVDTRGETSRVTNLKLELKFTSGESTFAVDADTINSIKALPDGKAQLTLKSGKTYSGTVSGTISGEAELGDFSLDAKKLRELVFAGTPPPRSAPSVGNIRAVIVTDAKGTTTSITNPKLTSLVVTRGKTSFEVNTDLVKTITHDGDRSTLDFFTEASPLVGVVSSGELSGQSDLGEFSIHVAKTKIIDFAALAPKSPPAPFRSSGLEIAVTDAAGETTTFTSARWEWKRYVSHCSYMIHTFCNCGGHTEWDQRSSLPVEFSGGCARIVLDKIAGFEVKEPAKDKLVATVTPQGSSPITGIIGHLPTLHSSGRLAGVTPVAAVRLDPKHIAAIRVTKPSSRETPEIPTGTKTSSHRMSFKTKGGLTFQVSAACMGKWGSKSGQGVPGIGSTTVEVTVGESKFNVSFDKIDTLSGFVGTPLGVELTTTAGTKKTGTITAGQWLGGWTPWGDVWSKVDSIDSLKVEH